MSQRDWTKSIETISAHAHRRLEGQRRLMPSALRTIDTAFVPTNETERSRANTRVPTSPSERKIGKVGINITIDTIMIPPNSSDLTTAISAGLFLLIARDTCGKADPASKISQESGKEAIRNVRSGVIGKGPAQFTCGPSSGQSGRVQPVIATA
jgi:hypothetical protein